MRPIHTLALLGASTLLMVASAEAQGDGSPAKKPKEHGNKSHHPMKHSDKHSGESGHRPPHGAGHNHDFSDIDEWVERFEAPERVTWQKPAEVVAAMQIKPGSLIADIGAGTGYFAIAFARAVAPKGRVFAVDTEKGMVDHVNQRSKKNALEAVLVGVHGTSSDAKLPKAVDIVFICDTWHHIEKRPAYLKAMRRYLKPKARVFIVDFKKGELPVGPPDSMKLSDVEVKKEFASAGFKLKAEHDFLPHQYFLEFTAP